MFIYFLFLFVQFIIVLNSILVFFEGDAPSSSIIGEKFVYHLIIVLRFLQNFIIGLLLNFIENSWLVKIIGNIIDRIVESSILVVNKNNFAFFFCDQNIAWQEIIVRKNHTIFFDSLYQTLNKLNFLVCKPVPYFLQFLLLFFSKYWFLHFI